MMGMRGERAAEDAQDGRGGANANHANRTNGRTPTNGANRVARVSDVRGAKAHPGPRRKGHSRRTVRSAAAERRRQQNARQTHPNIADLPRSAPIAAVEAALRRRANPSRPRPTPSTPLAAQPVSEPVSEPAEPTAAPRPARISTPLWRRLSEDAARGVTVFRRTGATVAAAPVVKEPPSARLAPRAVAPAAASAGALSAPVIAQVVAPARPAVVRRPWLRAHLLRVVITALMLLAITVALIPAPSLAYHNTLALAESGVAHLKTAEADFKTLSANPTNLATIDAAQQQLQLAHDDFFQLQMRLALASPAALIPGLSGKLASANKLVPLAVDGTQAGVLGCDALKTLVRGLKDPLGTSGGLTSADMNQIISDVDQITTLYGQMEPRLASLTPGDLSLDPRLAPLVDQLRSKLPQITQMINDVDGVAHALPQLLGVGAPATYLVLVLDSSELRPTGGFIGNFGALTLDGGRLQPGFHISDITLIDSSVKFASAPYQQFIPIPSKYSWLNAVFIDPNGNSWSLRDSNLDPNYPTAAQYALDLYPLLLPDARKNLGAQQSSLQLYDPAQSGQFAGVITLSLGIFEEALKITGPISVPEFHETVTSSNFVSKIHSYALGAKATGPDNKACGQTSCAKTFTSAVVSAFMAKVKSNLPQYVGQMGKLLYASLRTKDVEVYLTPTAGEQMLRDLHLSAEVAAPSTGDTVYEVEANVGANKDNYFLKYKMADQITLDGAGNATHKLAWSYTWPNDPATLKETFAAGGPDYSSYVRVFTPPHAKFIAQQNLVGFGTGGEFERKVFHGSVGASYASTSSYGLSWKVPNVVTHDGSGYHYHLTFQREAGIVWPLNIAVTLPKCAVLQGDPVTSGLTAQDHVAVANNVVSMTGPLTMDAQIEINYTCSPYAGTASPTSVTSHALRAGRWSVVAARLGYGNTPSAA
ncbi:MAG: DUF4012 domain-containing protein [Ktedonobacterales bacterium]